MKPSPSRPCRQSGTTMLEVLIAIVVFSFGMLGMLGMIVNGLMLTSSSNYRTIAAEQLTAMANFMNANPTLYWVYAAPPSSAITSNCLTTSGCTSGDLAASEYGIWKQNIAKLLPSGQGTVSTAANGRPLVQVCWDETRVSISGATTCFSAQL